MKSTRDEYSDEGTNRFFSDQDNEVILVERMHMMYQ